ELKLRTRVLDQEVEKRRTKQQADQIPSLYPHWDVEPWPEPVDTGILLRALTEQITAYVATLGNRAIVVALWIMFTWVIDGCTHSPTLLVTSPEADSGKTTMLGVISFLARRAIDTVSLTPAVLFRLIERYAPTLIGDEMDTAFTN